MKTFSLYFLKFSVVVIFFTLFSCKDQKPLTGKYTDTPISGSANIAIDHSIEKLLDNLIYIFHHQYEKTKINASYLSESQVIDLMKKDSVSLGVLTRTLNESEMQFFQNKKIRPIQQEFASDALVVLTSQSADSVLTVSELKTIFETGSDKFNKIIFSQNNYNSMTCVLNFLNKKYTDPLPKHFFSINDIDSLILYVSKNPQSLALVPATYWDENLNDFKAKNIKHFGIEVTDSIGNKTVSQPFQSYIADLSYPLTRKLYTVSVEGRSGLGTGFATFVSGDIGRRIILRNGLVPQVFPVRQIDLKDKIK